jgi:hypothetical protein
MQAGGAESLSPRQGREGSGSFVEKRTKKLLLLWGMLIGAVKSHAPESKQFLRRFFKNRPLPLPHYRFFVAISISVIPALRTISTTLINCCNLEPSSPATMTLVIGRHLFQLRTNGIREGSHLLHVQKAWLYRKQGLTLAISVNLESQWTVGP